MRYSLIYQKLKSRSFPFFFLVVIPHLSAKLKVRHFFATSLYAYALQRLSSVHCCLQSSALRSSSTVLLSNSPPSGNGLFTSSGKLPGPKSRKPLPSLSHTSSGGSGLGFVSVVDGEILGVSDGDVLLHS